MGLRTKLFALLYDRVMAGVEEAGLADLRSGLLARAAGDVLEVGAGTGHNLAHYGAEVRTLTVTEPDPSMLHRLERAAASAGRPVTVRQAPAEDLPFPDESFDTVVSTLVLCGVDDAQRAVSEMRRALRPGGCLLFAEHVRAGDDRLARRQDRVDWLNHLVLGCHCNRATLQTLQAGDLEIVDVADRELPESPQFVRPMIVGCARRVSRRSAP